MVICIFVETINFVLVTCLIGGVTIVIGIPFLSDPPVTDLPSYGPVCLLEVHPLYPQRLHPCKVLDYPLQGRSICCFFPRYPTLFSPLSPC